MPQSGKGLMGLKVIIIGAGFGGLSAAALLSKTGHDVTVIEKNEQPGGRASVYKEGGFTFDMGPSWYLMPDIFERYFAELDKKPEDLFELDRLDPHYRIYFGDGKDLDVSKDIEKNYALFDTLEEDGGEKLKRYLESAEEKYEVSMKELMYRDYNSLLDFFNRDLLSGGIQLPMIFESLDRFVNGYFDSDKARKIVEYSIGFLGGSPKITPALYHIMSYIDFKLGVWFPKGGIGTVAKSIYDLAVQNGTEFRFNEPVIKIIVEDKKAKGVVTQKGTLEADVVVVNADYPHAEMDLLEEKYRTYPRKYWEKKMLAPSAFIAYLGFNRRLDKIAHHTLFLDKDWEKGFDELFAKEDGKWPASPSYYINSPSRTDPGAFAPEGCETVFLLVPVAPGLEDNEEIRERFLNQILDDLEGRLGERIRDDIVVKRIFTVDDFTQRYNAYRGTALGITHTLMQTAVFRPHHLSKKVGNLYYTGQYTHPGIGVPMTLISSQIVAEEINEAFAKN
jgi:phytoene desaturase